MKKLLIILAMSSIGLNYCSEVHKENKEANEALINAIGEGHLDKVTKALHDGANIDTRDQYGSTALLRSIKNLRSKKKVEIAKFLIKSGADVNLQSGYDNETPLMNLVLHCGRMKNPAECVDLVSLLIQHRANLELTNEDGENALFLAIGRREPNVLEKLLYATKDINKKNNGETPLTYIAKQINAELDLAKRGHECYAQEIVDPLIEKMILLLESGADPDLQNDKGKNLTDFLHIPQIKEAFNKYLKTPEGQKRKQDFCKVLETHLGSHDIQGLVAEYCAFAPIASRG